MRIPNPLFHRLSVVALAVVLLAVIVPFQAEEAEASTAPFYYRVTNGSTTEVLEALVDGRTAIEFYDYSSGDSSSHTGYEESQTLSVFLWSGPEGKSLVFMADEANDGSGGDLKVEIAGLPDGASWSVKDDPQDIYTTSSAYWKWINCCTDGGVMDLATNDAIALNMTFPVVSGLSVFRLFGGPAEDPQFVTFDPSQPLVIETFQTPGAPGLDGTAGPGAGDVSLTATPPADDGGDPVTGYALYEVSGGTYTWLANSTDGAFLLTDVAPGTTHTYIARAINLGGEGDDSASVEVTTYDVPGAPSGLEATAGPEPAEVSLSWAAPADDGGTAVTRYMVYRDGAAVAETNSTTYVDRALHNATTYTYEVAAKNIVGEGPRSVAVQVTTFDVPGAPENLASASGPGRGEITLSWEAPADDGGTAVTKYGVYRDGILIVNTTTTGYVDTGLADGAYHFYEVAAVNVVGPGPLSPGADANTFDVPGAPEQLDVRSGERIGTTELEWSAPGDGGTPIHYYTVYAGSSPDDLHPIAEVTGTSHTDGSNTTVPLPEARYYAVTATNMVGESEASETGCGVHYPYGRLTPHLCG